ncbi:MAG: XRE family transcriptional regulator [Thermoanaerobaculia bacterium]
MATRVEALVKPALLVWGRESTGLDLEAAAKKLQVSPERLSAWEGGAQRPTVKQLRKIARVYRRPIAVFYLPRPPKDFQAMHDFRRLPGEVAGGLSPELAFEIRWAQDRREIALELHQRLYGRAPRFALRADLANDPEKLSESIRAELGVTLGEQFRLRHPYGPFNYWRTAIENYHSLVFQMSGVEPSEARAFSVSELPLPAIVVNIKDSPRARCFSLLHELTHILLRTGGLCDLNDRSARAGEDLKVEAFCNAVAGAALVPADALLAEPLVRRQASFEWHDSEIESLSGRFGVSQEVILRRLLALGRTTEHFYASKRLQYLERFRSQEGREAGGFAPPFRMALSRAGDRFARTVLASYYQDEITASDVAEFLDVGLQHLDKIEMALQSRSEAAA